MKLVKVVPSAALLLYASIYAVRDCSAQENPVNFYIFDDCSATSTQGPDFDPRRALQPGTGYWSSAGGLPDDEEVTWTGHLATKGKIKGVWIRWEYAPGEVQLSVSEDGTNFHTAKPFAPSASSDAKYDEEIYFPVPEEAELISVTMRRQTHGFYGINEIRPIGAGRPLMMLVAGITSPAGHMCLQVEAGKLEEGADIVLESCENALAAGDGRELWQSNPQMQLVAARSRPPRCMTLQDGSTDGKSSRLSSIRIEWEYPALSYVILTSEDGKDYKEQASNRANPSPDTLDELGAVKAQYVEIRMQRPHPRLGLVGEKYFYGISAVHVFANRLGSVVASCTQAANSDDARDKYFVEYVTHFDSSLATRVSAMEDDVLARQNGLDAKAEKLEELFPKMENCHREKLQHDERLDRAVKKADAISAEFFAIAGIASHHHNTAASAKPGDAPLVPAEDCYSIKEHDSKAVSGFYWIMPRCASEPLRVYCDMNTGTSIYVWNGTPARTAGATLEDVASVEDVRQRCVEVGLEPIVIKSPSHFSSIAATLFQMGYHLNGRGFVPLAFDYSCFDRSTCSGYYQDMNDGATDLTALILLQSDPESVKVGMNTAGLGTDGAKVSFFDITSVPINAVICSTNTMEGESMPSIDIGCDTTAENHEVFKGIVNTNVVVACPGGCAAEEEWPVYGSDGIYTATSSICRAAIHAGLIKNEGLVNVSLESPRTAYEGSNQNGISSQAFEVSFHGGATGSVRIGPLMKDCPSLATSDKKNPSYGKTSPARQASTSFLETSSSVELSSSLKKEPPSAFSASAKADYNLHEALERTSQLIDRMHGIDPEIEVVAKENAGAAVGNARKHLKPAEKLQQKQDARSLGVYVETEALTTQLLRETGETYETLEQLKSKLQGLEEELILQKGFESFEYKENTASSTRFSDLFDTFDSPKARHGPSNWGYSLMQVGGKEATFGQSTAIAGISDIDGSYAMLRGKRFFDSVIHVQFYALGSGTVGISFKMRDFRNMYLLWMNQKQGVQRLLRIENGAATVLAERKDGGYIQGKWYHVRIETQRGIIKVDSGENDTEVTEAFSILDQRFSAGSVGFFSSGMESGVFFRKLHVEAMECVRPRKTVPPAPPRCALFRETYTGNPMLLYRKFDATEAAGAAGAWEYAPDVGGREKVLAQINAVRGPAQIGTNLVLQGNRLCKNGYFSFEFFPQCTGGIVGGIFRFAGPQQYNVVELGDGELRIRTVSNGRPTTTASVPASMILNEWHLIKINFEGPSITVKLEVGETSLTLSREDFFGGDPRDGLVGLSAYNCGGVGFDNIQLAPYQLETITMQSTLFFSELTRTAKAWESCTKKVTSEDRQEECREIFRKEPAFRQSACAHDFCENCCVYYTSLLSRRHQLACERQCTVKTEAAAATLGGDQQEVVQREKHQEKREQEDEEEQREKHHMHEQDLYAQTSALYCLESVEAHSQCESGDVTCRLAECRRCCAAAASSSKERGRPQEDMHSAELNDFCLVRCEGRFPPQHVEL